MSKETPLDDNELAFSALNLFGNAVQGDAPDWQELTDWQSHTLTDKRSAEVLSHIANDPVYFQRWLDLCEATQWVEEESFTKRETKDNPVGEHSRNRIGGTDGASGSPLDKLLSTLKNWLSAMFSQPLTVYGGAFAALMLAVLVVPLMRESDSITLQAKIDRNLDLYMKNSSGTSVTAPVNQETRDIGDLFDDVTVEDVELHYFRSGMGQSLDKLQTKPDAAWTQWRADLTTRPLDCHQADNSATCELVEDDFRAIGQWVLLGFFACQQPITDENQTFWKAQYKIYQELKQTETIASSVVLNPVLSKHDPTTPESLCNAVDELMRTGQ